MRPFIKPHNNSVGKQSVTYWPALHMQLALWVVMWLFKGTYAAEMRWEPRCSDS